MSRKVTKTIHAARRAFQAVIAVAIAATPAIAAATEPAPVSDLVRAAQAARADTRAPVRVITSADLSPRPRVSVIGPRAGVDPYEGLPIALWRLPERPEAPWRPPARERDPLPRSGRAAARDGVYRVPGVVPWFVFTHPRPPGVPRHPHALVRGWGAPRAKAGPAAADPHRLRGRTGTAADRSDASRSTRFRPAPRRPRSRR